MATPRQLVETMAEALGIPVETVTNYDRVLSEQGLRSKSGRGRGAAKVSAEDAANLLIAILGSPIAGASVKEAANTCRTYGSLPALGNVGTHKFAKCGLKVLDDLPKKHTLRDGISALIASAVTGKHYRKRHHKSGTVDDFCGIRLTSQPWAEIKAETSDELLAPGEGYESARLVYHMNPVRSHKELRQERRVTYRTIRILGSLLSESRP
jgi:hypothetical protein